MADTRLPWYFVKGLSDDDVVENYRQAIKTGKDPLDEDNELERATSWRGRLPICPYGCGREGTLLETVMGSDGRATGIFNDHPCGCIFVADIEVGEPPAKSKLVIGPDGEYKEVYE